MPIDWKAIAEACVDSINHPERSAWEKPLITLVFKGRLPGKGWPRPKRLLCINPRGERVYHYDAMNFLAAMAAHNLVTVKGVNDSENTQ